MHREQTVRGAAPLIEDAVEQVFRLAARDRQAEVVGGDILDVVRLVEDDDAILRQDADVAPAERANHQVGEKEGVIDYEDVRLVELLARLEVEAVGVVGTALAQAVARIALDQLPDRPERTKLQVAAAAVGGALRPLRQRVELLQSVRLGQERRGAPLGDAEAAPAEVVAAALDEQRQERFGHDLLQERDVLADELLLQADRVRGDDDPAFLVGAGRLDRRDERILSAKRRVQGR